jgi:hypothetical protein
LEVERKESSDSSIEEAEAMLSGLSLRPADVLNAVLPSAGVTITRVTHHRAIDLLCFMLPHKSGLPSKHD